ncbi:MAG: transposase [Balneolaceae bacterium]|nr:transposase [Balneolaceae bacterium]
MSFYRRNLPHWQPNGAEYFVTFRLAGSLPKEKIAEFREEKRKLDSKIKQESLNLAQRNEIQGIIQKKKFQKYESILDRGEFGPTWLKESEIAEVVKDSIHFREDKDYELYAYCIMSNHVHIVFKHLNNSSAQEEINNHFPITKILESLKKFTARRCNKILNRTGQTFWQAESYDHVVRDEDELERIIRYVIYNPVKSKLVTDWREWKFTFCKPQWAEQF